MSIRRKSRSKRESRAWGRLMFSEGELAVQGSGFRVQGLEY